MPRSSTEYCTIELVSRFSATSDTSVTFSIVTTKTSVREVLPIYVIRSWPSILAIGQSFWELIESLA
jgi:hypothetical protein